MTKHCAALQREGETKTGQRGQRGNRDKTQGRGNCERECEKGGKSNREVWVKGEKQVQNWGKVKRKGEQKLNGSDIG